MKNRSNTFSLWQCHKIVENIIAQYIKQSCNFKKSAHKNSTKSCNSILSTLQIHKEAMNTGQQERMHHLQPDRIVSKNCTCVQP